MKLVGTTKRFSKSHKEITMMESYFWKNRRLKAWNLINPFQPSVAINAETSHLICGAKKSEKSVKATFSVKFENKQWTQDVSWKSIWGKVLKSRSSKICVRQPLKNLKGHGLPKDHIPSKFFKAVYHKFYLFHPWILCPI